MHTADYIDIKRATARACELDPDEVSTEQFRSLRTSHHLRLAAAWQNQIWPFLNVRGEKRFFRDQYSLSSTYTATNEVFYIGPRKHYQALTSVPTSQPPATQSGSSWTTNLTYWAESATVYSAAEYVSTATYTRGKQVFYTPTQRYYQLHAATSTGNAPTDTTKWGVLTEFRRYVAYEQTGQTAFDHVFAIWDQDPGVRGDARRVQGVKKGSIGYFVLQDLPWVYLDYRARPSSLSGDAWDQLTAYASGDQVYFEGTTFTYRGNFYTCTATTSAGQSPQTTPAKWTVVPIPFAFQDYLIHGAAADWLRPNTEDGLREEGLAGKALEDQALIWLAQTVPDQQMNVLSR